MKHLLFLILTLTVLTFLFPQRINAQEIGLGIYPPVSTVDALPPASVLVPLSVENSSTEPLTVALELKPFLPSSEEDGTVTYLSDDTVFPSGDVLLLQRIRIIHNKKQVSKLTLAPKEIAEVDVSIPLSKQTVPGDYYFSVIFTGQASLPGPEQNTQSSISQAGIASHILLSVGPKKKAQGEIKEFSSPFFLTQGPAPFTLRLTNTSPHTIAPTGSVYITNMFGQTVGKVDLLPVHILSNSTRLIPDRKQVNEDGEVKEALYEEFLTHGPRVLWQESFLLGVYHATVKVKLSENGPILSQSTTFIAFPLPFLIGFGVVILLVITIIQRVRIKIKSSY